MATAPLTVRHMSDPDAPRLVAKGDRLMVYVIVDVAGRTLYPHVPQHDKDYGPGRSVMFGEEDYLSAPPVMDFLLHLTPTEHAVNAQRFVGNEAGAVDEVLDEIAPDVARMLDAMAKGPGGAPDWSVTSRAIAEELKHRLDRWPYRGTEYEFAHDPSPMIDATELFTTRPELVRPEWARMDSEELDSAAKRVLLDAGRPAEGESWDDYHRRTRIVGVRSWLYAYRAGDAGGLSPVDAAAWPGIVAHVTAVRDDSTDAELERFAKAATAAAEAEGLKLIAAGKHAVQLRERRRQDVRDQLKAEGERIARLEEQLKPAKLRRRALVTRVLSWDATRDTDTAIAREAAMSHTAVAAIRASLNADDDQDEAAAAA